MTVERTWKWWAGGLAAVAVALTLHTALSAPRHRQLMSRKTAALKSILHVQSRWAPEEAYRRQLEQEGADSPADLEQIATRTLGAGTANLSAKQAEASAGGWQRREVSVSARNVAFDEFAVFLAQAAETPPAWRLREIEWRPSSEPGKGGVTCVLEALEKKHR